MEPFESLTAVFVTMPGSNIDTDQIIPARFLQKPRREGCGPWLFHDLRYSSTGAENPAFVLNQTAYRNARVLIAGDNFGCGSSRENAVWALYDYGFRVVIAPGFGDIFYNNCLKNGLLPVRLAQEAIDRLVESSRAPTITVDLSAQTVTAGDSRFEFEIDPFAKHCLLSGIDELGYTLSRLDEIMEFERHYEQTIR
jgi:3-isopropylmalate/(R)-2-methylmalate dehydratase small subunit